MATIEVAPTTWAPPGIETLDAATRRTLLLDRVDAVAPILAAEDPVGEQLGHLSDATVAALVDGGLVAMKTPTALGGWEAEPDLQYEIIERVARYNACAAWCLFIYADIGGTAGAFLSDEGLAEVFADGRMPVLCGGGGLRPGRLEPVPGGYRLNGRFRYGSGIHHADWVLLAGLLDDGSGGPPKVRRVLAAKRDLEVLDTWHVHGMRGTGSTDYAAHDVFVPEARTFAAGSAPQRGGRMYRTGTIGYIAHTLPGVAIAIAQRTLDELCAQAGTVTRGYARPRILAERPTFQHFVGEADQRLRAVRRLMIADGHELMEAVDRGEGTAAAEAASRAAASHAVRTAAAVLTETVNFAGGPALYAGADFERAVRDMAMVTTHLMPNETAFEIHGQFKLGLPGADPMA